MQSHHLYLLPLSTSAINNDTLRNNKPENPRGGDVSDTDQEPDLPSELGSALGDQDIDIPATPHEEEVEHFTSGFAAMTSIAEGQSSMVPNPELNPNPGQSEQPSAPASQPTIGCQQQLTHEQADYWHQFYHPEQDHSRSGSNGVNGGQEFNLNQVTAYLALNAHVYTSNHVKIRLALSYMTTGVAGAFTSNYIAKYVNRWEDVYPNMWASFKETLYVTFEAGDQKAQVVIKLKSLTQGDRPLENYTAEFLGLFNQARLLPSSIEGGVLFAQGLSRNLRDHILDRQHPPRNVNEWVKAAREVYTSQISKDIYNKGPNTPQHPNPFTFPHSTLCDPNVMDVDQAQCTPCHWLSVHAVTCYNCGREGHIHRECQEKHVPKFNIKRTECSTYKIEPRVAEEILNRQAEGKSERVFELLEKTLKDF
ncbi:hypothetical protein PISMIDRAFT_11024 [Pisolithus microcarpus 441]|uniref:CCHC-type domain-containing protein n=1 Tax=Pisolithus microcarpus 441 TaxID=765257 RepID=A0A0C9ZBB7_9AGAM|nr:hypothetical protein PISMIDRAFT_11024 [Pisolithus microcarpus 441]